MRRSPNLHRYVTVALLHLALAATAWGQYAIVGTSTSTVGPLSRTETTVQDGAAPIDQFKIVRLAKTDLTPSTARGIIFFLPALGVEFTSYEETEPRRPIGASIAGFFAQRNMIVYGYSARSEGLPAGGCEAGVIDCSPMADWNLQTLVDDVAFARGQIAIDDPGLPVFVGGVSLGAIATLAVLDDAPGDYAGAFLWEGTLFSADPVVRGLNQAYCAGLEAQLAAGLVYDGFGNNLFKKVAKLAQLQPTGLTPIPLFPSFLTNRQVLVSFLVTPAPGPASMPVPGYVFTAGDPTTGELFHTDDARLFENVARFDDYAPLATVRDVSCSLAGVETGYIDDLGQWDGPILAIGGALGFGPYLHEAIALTSSTDVTLQIEAGFGHVDHLLAADHRRYVERPIWRWLTERLP